MLAFKDANGRNTTVSVASPLPVSAGASTIIQPDGSGITEIGTTYSKFSDGFNNSGDTAPDPARWTVLRQNLITAAISAGALSLTVPTTAGAEYLMVGKMNTTIPANLMAVVAATARSANTSVRVGYVACDPTTGLPIPHATLPNDFANRGNVNYNSATATSSNVETVSTSSTAKVVAATGGVSTASPGQELAIELRAEDITVAHAVPDTIGSRSGGWRISSQLPNPNAVYRPFIWVLNTGTATASVWTFQRFLSMDIQELQAEIGGGRGNASASQSIPVNLVQSIQQTVSGTVALGAGTATIGNVLRSQAWNESTAVIGASATFNGASRDSGAASGAASIWSSFKAFVRTDQTGTANLQGSNDGTTWITIVSAAIAGAPVSLSTPCFFRYHRIQVVNGTTATTTTFVNSAYSL